MQKSLKENEKKSWYQKRDKKDSNNPAIGVNAEEVNNKKKKKKKNKIMCSNYDKKKHYLISCPEL